MFNMNRKNFIPCKIFIRLMKAGIIPLTGIIIMSVLIFPVSALSAEEIDTSNLDIPEVETMDLSETPIGSLESIMAYAERLIAAAEELLNFIESIFEMLGMEDNPDVEKLMKILNEGKDMTNADGD